MDGQCNEVDHALMRSVSNAFKIPVIASSGAGKKNVQATLAAGMFHRKEVEISAIMKHMEDSDIPARKEH
eukprot:4428885-Ditylum_brightwellii.AAC.1